MNRGCLSEVALMRLHAGLASAPQNAHVTRCERCTAHYRRLISDLEIITGIVMDTAITPAVGVSRRHRWTRRRLALASAIAATLVIALALRAPVSRPPVAGSPPKLAVPAPAAGTLSTDPDALVTEPLGVDGGCSTGDDDAVAGACQDDDSVAADSDGSLEIG